MPSITISRIRKRAPVGDYQVSLPAGFPVRVMEAPMFHVSIQAPVIGPDRKRQASGMARRKVGIIRINTSYGSKQFSYRYTAWWIDRFAAFGGLRRRPQGK